MLINSCNNDLLKEPFGILIPDSEITKEKIFSFIKDSEKIVTVGDTTTKKFLDFGFIPNLSIIDNKEKRIAISDPIKYCVDDKIFCKNKPGELNIRVIDIVKKLISLDFDKIQIIIDGEEDIVALPLFVNAPDNWTIFYGQPNEGMVIVKMGERTRERALDIFNKVIFSN
ncbi:MAG TPA: DUF359 domain-containing protein [Candidatus Nitrosocosmicus sp.]